MKKFTFIIASAFMMIFGGNVMSAQGKYGADSAECIKYLSYYKEYYKSKNFDSALPNCLIIPLPNSPNPKLATLPNNFTPNNALNAATK